MSYTVLAVISVFLVIFLDLFVFKSKLVMRKSYWTAYSIILFFQLITNWWLTSRGILTYSEEFILGYRVASAPVEDLLFGYSMVTLTLILWIFWGRKGVERN
ncbi:MAG: lycopene cyclase domain-containing protein [Actinomycetales bacterium]|jgi:lycopene cyclase domain-containing protein